MFSSQCHTITMCLLMNQINVIFRLFCFDESSCIFYPMNHFSLSSHCLLYVTHLLHPSESTNQDSAFVLTAGTDGRIALWDITNVVILFCETLESRKTRDTELIDSSHVSCNTVESIVDETLEELVSDSSDSEYDDMSDSNDNASLQPSCTVIAHQCGVNAVAVHRLKGKCITQILLFNLFHIHYFSVQLNQLD